MAIPRQYQINSKFSGYRNNEDITNLNSGILVKGSKNVLTNESEQIETRQGYTLDGSVKTSDDWIRSSFTWNTYAGYERNMRSYGEADAGVLQYRYVDSSGTVTWRDLMTTTKSANYNYTTYWDAVALLQVLLFVNGEAEINEWTGAITTIDSNDATTLTKEGTTTWAEEGFTSTGSVTINGTDYVYTGGAGTTTLTGLTGLPAFTTGDIVHQTPKTTLNSAMTDINTSFKNDLIATRLNQVYIGSLTSNQVYTSKPSDYTDYSTNAPRLYGDGNVSVLDGTLKAFVMQEENLYVSAGKDLWYKTNFVGTTTSTDIANVLVNTQYEALSYLQLATAPLQAAKSQALTGKIKNNVAFLTEEKTLCVMGKVQVQDGVHQSFYDNVTIIDISESVQKDFDIYDFSNGSVFYHKNRIYVSLPAESLVLIYNQDRQYWEAPQTISISRFYLVDGELYGHSGSVNESYKLFDGTSDNGLAINAVAKLSYENYGARYSFKNFNELYAEGYISTNTVLTMGVKYDYLGCGTYKDYEIEGTDVNSVCLAVSGGSLGEYSLGELSLGGRGETEPEEIPKFRWKKSTDRVDFFECQYSFETNGIDQQWKILAVGSNVQISDKDTIKIKH